MAKLKIMRDPIALRTKKLKDGRESLYLDIYTPACGKNHSHRYEFLKLYLLPETNAENKKHNAVTLRAAKAIQAQRSLERINGVAGISKDNGNIRLADYIDAYVKKRKGVLEFNTLKTYMQLANVVRDFNQHLQLRQINKECLQSFITFLAGRKNKNTGETINRNTAHLQFTALGTVLKSAYSDGYIKENPVDRLIADDKRAIGFIKPEREYLIVEELQRLKETPVPAREKNADAVARAFFYACYTGLRISDIKRLQWKQIKNNGIQDAIELRQKKTERIAYVPLSHTAMQYLPERGNDNDYVFNLPTNLTINRIIRRWVKAAGIAKDITFHCSRHTFATLLLTAGADLYTTSKLLGHANITTTQVYADIINQKKAEAVNLLDNL